jgi:hypothetical protein
MNHICQPTYEARKRKSSCAVYARRTPPENYGLDHRSTASVVRSPIAAHCFCATAQALRVTSLREPSTQWYHAMHAETWELRMPYYTFDLVLGEEFKTQGSIMVQPELKAKGCAVRVTDADNQGAVPYAARSCPKLAFGAPGGLAARPPSRRERRPNPPTPVAPIAADEVCAFAPGVTARVKRRRSNDQAANRRSNSAGA